MANKTLKLALILADPVLNVREGGVDRNLVNEYAEVFDQLPPVEVYEVRGQNYLVDGFHRFGAAKQNGLDQITVEYHSGKTWQEAEARAAEVNTHHGKALTADEKMKAARVLLRLAKNGDIKGGQAVIAQRLGMSQQRVSQIARADIMARQFDISNLSTTHWVQVARMPEGERKGFAERVSNEMWTSAETKIAADALLDPERSDDYKARLRSGEADPIQKTNGEASVSTDTLARKIKQATESDTKTAVWEFLRAKAMLDQDLPSDQDATDKAIREAGFSVEDLDRIENEMLGLRERAARIATAAVRAQKLHAA